MAQFIQKPVYTPNSQIRIALYTEGKEFMYADTLEEYIGLYHKYPNNAVYSLANWVPGKSRPIIAYVNQSSAAELLDNEGNDIGNTSSNNGIYFRLTESRFNNHYKPPYYYPRPTEELYDVGYFDRYFAQKINDDADITEITSDEFDRKNIENKPGIDEGLYRFTIVQWTIDGPIEEVRLANKRVIAHAELNGFNALKTFLSDLDEYHKQSQKI
jgi:hypothetical protein